MKHLLSNINGFYFKKKNTFEYITDDISVSSFYVIYANESSKG